ncbi:MAG TPA: thiamine ABC transporter substrate-binding protein [Candidatus Thermoplasmatota archaeon]|nr:thiamine ABC transporter substrate-binding protein [Candidatus Thermoplasmatota archaeon]
MKPAAALLLLTAPLLAGCAQPPASATTYAAMGFKGDPTGAAASLWPDLTGQTVTILDQGAFDYLFTAAQPLFENLTHAKLRHVAALDAGEALQRATREAGDPSFDVVYGIDNVLLWKAAQADVFTPYKPVMAGRISPDLVFFGAGNAWTATPVDHGYTAINVDPRSHATVNTLRGLVPVAGQFVTEDPRTSSPGLGFLAATVATFGEKGASGYDYLAYWDDLFTHGVLVTPGWTEAYAQHFTAGYGAATGANDRAIVNSYTTSPAYEAFNGATTVATVLTAPKSTFHQVETMGIARGTRHLAAAQAWIEFTLTDAYQALQAPNNAVYPVVPTVEVASVYGHADPAPGSFEDAGFSYTQLGANAERWVREWTDLYERRHA